MALLDHTFNDLDERRFDIERDDVGARNHYVRSGPVVNFENIADEDAFMRAQRVRAVDERLLDHFVDGLAQALAVARTPDQPKEVTQTSKRPIGLPLAVTLRRLGITHG